MTPYEHAMLAIDTALAAGLHRRGGWQIIALAGTAAVLPDWDGLTLLAGAAAYAEGHRVWGHNLLAATLAGTILAVVAYRFALFDRLHRALAKRWKVVATADPGTKNAQPRGALALWIAVGVLAAMSHLAADLVFSSGKGLSDWPVPLAWPFSDTAWARPMVRWGDVGPAIVFSAGLLAMARWRSWTQPIAAVTLALVGTYILARGLWG